MAQKIRMTKGVAEDEIMTNLEWNVLDVVNLVIMYLIVILSCQKKKIMHISSSSGKKRYG